VSVSIQTRDPAAAVKAKKSTSPPGLMVADTIAHGGAEAETSMTFAVAEVSFGSVSGLTAGAGPELAGGSDRGPSRATRRTAGVCVNDVLARGDTTDSEAATNAATCLAAVMEIPRVWSD
jgi:hypothetical protein